MSASLSAAAYAIFGFSGPFVLVPRISTPAFLVRCFAVWLLTALILFFLDDQLGVLLLAGLVVVILAPSDPVQRTCFFFVAVPCLPAYLQVYLPFPGINWLIMLTYYKVVVFFVLAPIMFRSQPQADKPEASFSIADMCVVIYIIVTILLVSLSMGPTAGSRFVIDQVLVLGIPYFVLSRVIRGEADLDACFRAILLVSLVLAGIAIVATLKQWDFYRLKEPLSVATISDVRSGLLRIAATANTHSLGYHLAIGFIFLQYLKDVLGLDKVRLWLLRGMLLAGLFFTNSRGAMLSLAVALVIYAIVMIKKAVLRRGMMILFACAFVVAGIWLVTTKDASGVDAYNSVGYRQLLLQISIQHIMENALFGDLHFLLDPKFRALVQGQGIIDITNLYLQIGLYFGVLGLVLFMAIFAPTLRDLMRVISRLSASRSDDRERVRKMSAIILSATFGWFVLILTTSDVALTLHLGLTLIAIARAISRFEVLKDEPIKDQLNQGSLSLRGLASRILHPPGARAS